MAYIFNQKYTNAMPLYRTSKVTNHPVIIYDDQIGRSGEYVKSFLKDWKGTYLHCNGYSEYKKLEGITLCGCLVHAKRKFHQAWQVNKSNDAANKVKLISKNFLL